MYNYNIISNKLTPKVLGFSVT